LNVALPTLARHFHADNSGLQWIVDAYTLVLAGLLLTAGSLGDRFGRRRCLTIGLIVFGTSSIASALAGSSAQLTATRAVMGIGAALIMPATLSIITDVFTVASERAMAIAVWAGVAALGIGLGPLVGGWLLQRFYWGSIFLVNVPVVIVAVVGGRLLIPESRDPRAFRLDPVGAVLSLGGLSALLFAIIEGPSTGWSSPQITGAFVAAAVGLGGFVLWELRVEEPMLDLRFFRNPRFTAASAAISAVFFGLFSLMFVLTQLLQSVLDYDALEAGVRVLPLSLMLIVVAPLSARAASIVGTKVVVALGLFTLAVGLLVTSTFGQESGYGRLAVAITLAGIGMGCAMAPATESIMGSLPRHKAGVGSAVNDTTRMMGGALGVAIVGSVLSSSYQSGLVGRLKGLNLPAPAQDTAGASIGAAMAAANDLGGTGGDQLRAVARQAFVQAAGRGLLVAAAVAVMGGIVVLAFLPPRASGPDDVEASNAPRVGKDAA
ncbi:MAG: MFS transporter, partial [Acidimicrobiales bacterium]